MRKALIETTVLTDLLLKTKHLPGIQARSAIRGYDETFLPVYAIKEFCGGPLKNFVWFHNKLAVLGSLSQALDALHKMSLTPRRYIVSTALEALRGAAQEVSKTTNLGDLVGKYGAAAKPDAVLADQYRLALKVQIMRAWRQRRKVTSFVIQELECYLEQGPREVAEQLEIESPSCRYTKECCLAQRLRARPEDLECLKNVIDKQSKKAENVRRRKALRSLYRTRRHLMTAELCRDLGDAYFALFTPEDTVILSTNTRDLAPLAESLGRKVASP